LKTGTCGKNEPKNEPGDIVENKELLKNEPKTNRRNTSPDVALFHHSASLL
jgi:hypothetical protein